MICRLVINGFNHVKEGLQCSSLPWLLYACIVQWSSSAMLHFVSFMNCFVHYITLVWLNIRTDLYSLDHTTGILSHVSWWIPNCPMVYAQCDDMLETITLEEILHVSQRFTQNLRQWQGSLTCFCCVLSMLRRQLNQAHKSRFPCSPYSQWKQ